MPLFSIINWLYIEIFLLYIKNDRNFTGSDIAIIKTLRQLCTYEAAVVSRSHKGHINLQLHEKHRFKDSETKEQSFTSTRTETRET